MPEMREILKILKTGGEMRKRSFFLLSFIVILSSVFLYGCGGGGPGSPGSDGSEKTGVILDATLAPTYLGANTNSVDAFQNPDCDGDPTTNDPESFTDHSATLTVNARLLNPNATFQPGNLHIEKYTIKYFRSSDSITAPPIETDVRFVSIPITPPTAPSTPSASTLVTATVSFADLVRKDNYSDDMLSGIYSSSLAFINNYTAVYKFEGKNDFGEKFSFEVQADFQIGNFDYCE
jgi:hypothetical protein